MITYEQVYLPLKYTAPENKVLFISNPPVVKSMVLWVQTGFLILWERQYDITEIIIETQNNFLFFILLLSALYILTLTQMLKKATSLAIYKH